MKSVKQNVVLLSLCMLYLSVFAFDITEIVYKNFISYFCIHSKIEDACSNHKIGKRVLLHFNRMILGQQTKMREWNEKRKKGNEKQEWKSTKFVTRRQQHQHALSIQHVLRLGATFKQIVVEVKLTSVVLLLLLLLLDKDIWNSIRDARTIHIALKERACERERKGKEENE